MSIRVSVVVAVYNTGEFIEPLIKSLLGQSLPADDFEMIFVDDGSSDGVTPARLDELAAAHGNVVVLHNANSGWPGKPRNDGIDLARGDYVFFADHDDWFAPEALARLVAYADANSSDVVIGKYAGHNRGVAKVLFSKSRPDATLANAPLMDSLTPHKLFRVAFLDEIGLRFPEGKRRLEDHVFVVEAYFRAARISVLADYTVYFHIGRKDAGNAGYQRIDPPSYYGYVRETVDIILRHTEPGTLRDKCLRRPMRQEILGRFESGKFLAQDTAYKRLLFDSARALAVDAIPPHVDAGLSVRQRVAAELLRADRFEDLLAYSAFQLTVAAGVELTRLDWLDDGRLDIDFAAWLVAGGQPLRYDRDGEDVLVPVPPLQPPVPPAVRVCTKDVDKATVQLIARRRSDSKEFALKTATTRELDGDSLRLQGAVVLDPRTLGRDQRGFWDFYVKVTQTGWTKEARLGRVRAAGVEARLALRDGTTVVPYWTTPTSDLTVRVGVDAPTFADALRPRLLRSGGALEVALPLVVVGDAPGAAVSLAPAGRGTAVETEAAIRVDGRGSALTVPVPRRRGIAVWRVRYSLRLPGWGRPRPTGSLVVTVGARPVAVLADPSRMRSSMAARRRLTPASCYRYVRLKAAGAITSARRRAVSRGRRR